MVGQDKIIEDVRILLDHNDVHTSIEGFDDIQLELDEIIANQVLAAARMTMLMAPRSYINWKNAVGYGSVGSWDSASPNAPYVTSIPSDFLRFGAAKMTKWKKAVSTYSFTADEEYAMQQSEFAGIRATNRKPLAVIAESAYGGVELQLYPHESGDTLQYFTYCPQPKWEQVGGGNALDISETLYEPFIYITGALVAETLKDTEKNNELIATARIMLTNTDEEAVKEIVTTNKE